MTREEYDQLNSDIRSLKEYNDFQEVKNGDSALYSRIINYKKNGIMSLDDMTGLLDEEKRSLPEGSLLLSKKDSLKSEAYKPVETPPQKPVEKSALETLYGTVFPRTQKRMEEKLPLGVGDVASVGLDVASLIPRISSNILQAPVSVWNAVQENMPITDAISKYGKNIGDIEGKSFQTPNVPDWAPGFIKDAASTINPIAEGIGEFGTSLHRGPIIPGGIVGKTVKAPLSLLLGKPFMTAASEAAPQALKTALGVVENLGTGAALGTSESVARGEGIDPFGTALGVGFGGLPYIGKGVQSWANKNSNVTSMDNLIKSYQDDLLHGDEVTKEVAKEMLESIRKLGKDRYAELLKKTITEGADIELSQEGNEAIRDFYMKTKNKNQPKVYVAPTSEPTLKQTVDKLTKWNDITVPGPLSQYSKEPIIRDVTKSRVGNNPLTQEEMVLLGTTGRLANAKTGLLNILLGHGPADLTTSLSSILPDATSVRNYGTISGNLARNPLTQYFAQQDSTRR